MSLFKKKSVLSNCKTEADIINLSAIRVNLRRSLREERSNIFAEYPCISKDDAETITIKSIDQEDILINLFCNALKSPIKRDADFSTMVERFKDYIYEAIKSRGYKVVADQPIANKVPEPEEPAEPEVQATETPAEPKADTTTQAAETKVDTTTQAAEPKADTTTQAAETKVDTTTQVAETTSEPKVDTTTQVAETPAEPNTDSTTKVAETSIDDETLNKIFKEVSDKTMNLAGSGRYNIQYMAAGLNEFNKFIQDAKSNIILPIIKRYLGDALENDNLENIMQAIYVKAAFIVGSEKNNIIGTISKIAAANGVDPVIAIYNNGAIDVQFGNDSFTIKSDAKNDDQILIDRRGKIIIQDSDTKEYYYLPLKMKDNNKNVFNTKAIEELFKNGSAGVINANTNGTAPEYIKDMYDTQTKAIVPVFDFSTIPTNLSNDRKAYVINQIYKAIPGIAQDVGGITQRISIVEIEGDLIKISVKGKNKNSDYNIAPSPSQNDANPSSSTSPATEQPTANKTPEPEESVEPKAQVTETPAEPKADEPVASTDSKTNDQKPPEPKNKSTKKKKPAVDQSAQNTSPEDDSDKEKAAS